MASNSASFRPEKTRLPWQAWTWVQPSSKFRRDRWFYVRYDLAYLALELGLIALMVGSGFRPWVQSFEWWLLLLIPLAAHVVITCNVFIHNCTHGNFPPLINRLVGELCAMVMLSRYASWEIVHRRHHRYSDDGERDPHPCVSNYWQFTWNMLVNVERQLQQQFYEFHGGDTPDNRAFERRRALLSYATSITLIAVWYLFLGPIAFFVIFVPAQVIAILHLAHFNWSTHNGFSKDQDFHPVNLDTGFFWVGNRLWHGIYWHENHHKQANLFNPGRFDEYLEKKRLARAKAA